MNTTPPVIHPRLATQLVSAMETVERALTVARDNHEVFNALQDRGAVLEFTLRGILIHEIPDPKKLALALMEQCDILFSRRLNDAGSYDWEADFHGVSIIFPAVEFIDHTGTIITKQP